MVLPAHKQSQPYQQAVLLAKEMYRITTGFPDAERTVLTYTLRRLAGLLCQQVALCTAKEKKAQKKWRQACFDTGVALDTQLEIALALHLVTAEDAADALRLLYAILQWITTPLK